MHGSSMCGAPKAHTVVVCLKCSTCERPGRFFQGCVLQQHLDTCTRRFTAILLMFKKASNVEVSICRFLAFWGNLSLISNLHNSLYRLYIIAVMCCFSFQIISKSRLSVMFGFLIMLSNTCIHGLRCFHYLKCPRFVIL